MNNVSKLMLTTILVVPLIISCIVQGRTRQFVVNEERSSKKTIVDGWTLYAPVLRAFYKQAGVGEIPGLDTTLFMPMIKVKRPSDATIYNNDLPIDSIIIYIMNEKTQYTVSGGPYDLLKHYQSSKYTSRLDTITYKYFYFDKDNSVTIPMSIDTVIVEFDAIIKDNMGAIIVSQPIRYEMIRQEKKHIGITWGD